MVQSKVSVQPKNTLKTEKRPATKKPSLQNNDDKIKVVDLKAIQMKKSRSIYRSDLDNISHSSTISHEIFHQPPGEPYTLVTPAKTPSSKKQPPYNRSPNYMKSTNSSELHKAGKLSTLKKVKTLTKASSFKHSRTLGTHKKVVFCENLDAKRATCSSSLKYYKFPSYLKLTPNNATEGEGSSVMKVCPYTYCSLNGHHHSPIPPLKSFLSSKRRVLKIQKYVRLEVVSPSKRKRSKTKVITDDSKMGLTLTGKIQMLEDQEDDFFVEIHVPRHDSPRVSDIEFQDDVTLSGMNFISEKSPPPFPRNKGSSECDSNVSDQEMDRCSSASLDQLFGEVSDMEWEEGQILAFDNEKMELSSVQKDCGSDQIEPCFKLEKFVDGTYIYDEIMECFHFTDADSSSDSESTLTVKDDISGEYDSNEVKLGFTVNFREKEQSSETEDNAEVEKAQQVHKGISDKRNYFINKLKLKKSVRCKDRIKETEEGREFKPRPPNFLPEEPEKEQGKVDLRHQEMDERRNAQDWMLDHALQKTLDQLAPERNRKVALLVEAFEAVLPVPK